MKMKQLDLHREMGVLFAVSTSNLKCFMRGAKIYSTELKLSLNFLCSNNFEELRILQNGIYNSQTPAQLTAWNIWQENDEGGCLLQANETCIA